MPWPKAAQGKKNLFGLHFQVKNPSLREVRAGTQKQKLWRWLTGSRLASFLMHCRTTWAAYGAAHIGLGLPASMKTTKIILHRHAYRPIRSRLTYQSRFPLRWRGYVKLTKKPSRTSLHRSVLLPKESLTYQVYVLSAYVLVITICTGLNRGSPKHVYPEPVHVTALGRQSLY